MSRIIAATALALGLPLVTRDTEIRGLTNVTTVW
jgi:predicted nucleic acid-binding protein